MRQFHITTAHGFEQFMSYWQPRLLHFVIGRNVLRADAEDLCQEAFLILWRKNLDSEDDPRKLLYGVANRLALAYHRKNTGLVMHSLDEWSDQTVSSTKNAAVDAEEADQRAALVDETLKLLTPRQREVIELVWLREYSHKDAAELLGISLNSLYLREKRALERCRLAAEQGTESSIDQQGR